MAPLRTTVLMKTDIAGSTPRFRALLSADLQALLAEHRAMISRLAAEHGGRIIRMEGDGHWLVFPSVTDAARAAIAMQEALRLAQVTRDSDRLSMRVVIGLGDVAEQDGDFIGEVLALITRIEVMTPEDEIYLTSAARLVLTVSEIRTALVDTVPLKGFAEPTPVYRVEQRHRTHVMEGIYILYSDLRRFTRLVRSGRIEAIERLFDALDTVVHAVAREQGGTIHFSLGDSHCMTFTEASPAMEAAVAFSRRWKAARLGEQFACPVNIVLHRGDVNAFRSFIYGNGMEVANRVMGASARILAEDEGGVFVTDAARAWLSGTPWHDRLRPMALPEGRVLDSEVYRLTPIPFS